MSDEAVPAPRIDNRLFVLILQHPQERHEPLATAAATVAALRRAKLTVGLSWPNLGRTLGRAADPKRWAVLYLGSARPKDLGITDDIAVLVGDGKASGDVAAVLRGLDGMAPPPEREDDDAE